MKKVILFLTIVLFTCFNLFYFQYFSLQKENAILYKNNLEVSIVYNSTTDVSEFIDKLETQSKKLKVNISQYVYLNDTTLNIYSSNIEYDSNIKLIEGKFPDKNSKQYISNRSLDKTKDKVGKIQFPKSDLNVRCYNFEQIKNIGVGNKFIISTDNRDSIPKIVELFKENGKTIILPNSYQNNSGINIRLIPCLVTILIVSIFLLLISIIYYLMRRKSKFSVQNLFGYSLASICNEALIPVLFIFFTGGFVVNGILTLYFCISSKSNYMFEFYCKSNLFLFVSAITLVVFIVICTILINRDINILLILKGNTVSAKLDIVVLISKIVIGLTICFIAGSFLNQYNIIQHKLDNIKYWDRTKNIYRITISNQGQDSNLALDRQYNDRLYLLYKDLKATKNAFIINSTNYSVFEEKNDKVTYLYDENASKGHAEYGTDGKSILIDEGYLKMNPIELTNNKTLQDCLDSKDTVLNILVPEKYKNIEKDIYNTYLDYFYFAKVKVDNIYNKELKLPLNKLLKSDLHVNIIYVKNNQRYFTYSDSTGSEMDHHYITDPISIIYDGKVDTSYIGAYASQSLYFVDDSEGNAYLNILQYLNKTQTSILVPAVNSIYKDVNKEINDLSTMNKNLFFVLIVLALIAFVFSVTYIRLYYENNSYKLYLKTIMGYSFISIYSGIICVMLILNMGSSIVVSVYLKKLMVVFWGLSLTLLEFIITIFSTYYLNRQNINKIVKGEK